MASVVEVLARLRADTTGYIANMRAAAEEAKRTADAARTVGETANTSGARAAAGMRDAANGARQAAGAFQDSAGRWRTAGGQFMTSSERAAAGVRNVGEAAQQTATKVSRTSGVMRSLAGLLAGGLITGGLFAIGAGLKSMATTAITSAASYQQSEMAFTTLLGSASKAKSYLGELTTMANSTPFELPQLITGARRLIAFGWSAGEAKKTLTAVGDTASGLGLGAEGIDRLTLALGQMKAKGKVGGDELLQMSEAGVPALQYLADAYHTTTQKMSAMITKGQIPATRGIKIISAAMEKGSAHAKGFGGMMAAQSKTLSGTWSTLVDTFRSGLVKAIYPYIPAITAMVQAAVPLIGTLMSALGKGIAGAVSVGKAIGTFASGLSRYGPVVGKFLDPLWQGVQRLRTGFHIPTAAFDLMHKAVGAAVQVLGVFRDEGLHTFSVVSGQVQGLLGPLRTLGGALTGTRGQFATILPSIIQVGGVFLHQILPAVMSVREALVTYLVPVLGKVAGFLIGQVLPTFVKFYGFLVSQIAPFISGVLVPTLGTLVTKIAGAVVPIVRTLAGVFTHNILPALQHVWNVVNAQVVPVLQKLVRVIIGIAGPVVKVAGAILGFAVTLLGKVIPPVLRFIGPVLGGLIRIIGDVIGWIFKLIGYVLDAALAFPRVASAVGRMASAVGKGIAKAVQWVGTLPSKIKGAATSAAKWLYDAGVNVVTGLMSGIRSMGSWLYSQVSAWVTANIPLPIRKALGIASPSRVTKALGRWVGMGLALGLASTSSHVQKVADNLVTYVKKAVDSKVKGATKSLLAHLKSQSAAIDVYAKRLDTLKTKLSDAKQALADLKDARASYASSVASTASSTALDMTAGATDSTAATAASIIAARRAGLKSLTTFNADYAKLKKLGLNKSDLDQIVQMGTEQGTAYAEALLAGGKSAVGQLNALQKQVSSVSTTLGNTSAGVMYDAGITAAQSLVKGLQKQEKALVKAMAKIAKKMAAEANKALHLKVTVSSTKTSKTSSSTSSTGTGTRSAASTSSVSGGTTVSIGTLNVVTTSSASATADEIVFKLRALAVA